MKNWSEELYRLLPAVHQIRDAEQSEALRLLMHVVGEQVQDVQDDIESLYENWFIETCNDWVVPYHGDLVGFQLAGDAGSPGDTINAGGRMLNRFLYPRREIANAVRRRRRKGTLSVLEDLASDVTRWPARAVEFSQSIAYCQNIQHPEQNRGGTAHLIDHSSAGLRPSHVQIMNSFNETAFNTVAHTVDTRTIQSSPGVGWYHPNKIGLFVWRRPVYSATRFDPCRICFNDYVHIPAYTFNRLGRQLPLYINRKHEVDESHIAEPDNLPVKLTRMLLRDRDGRASTDYYGLDDSKSLSISVVWDDGGPWESIPASQVHVCDLRNSDDRFLLWNKLPKNHVAVDPEMGVFLLGTSNRYVCALRVSYYYAAGDDLGGGEYDRRAPRYRTMKTIRVGSSNSGTACGPRCLFEEVDRLTRSAAPSPQCPAGISNSVSSLVPDKIDFPDGLEPKRRGWQLQESLCLELTTSDTFIIRACEFLEIAPTKTLEIRSAPGTWPLLMIEADGPHKCGQPWTVKLGAGSRLILAGLQIVGETLDLVESGKDASSSISPATCTPCTVDHSQQTPKTIAPVEVIIRHTTFVPPAGTKSYHCCEKRHASLTVRLTDARIDIQRSILGTIDLDHPRCQARDIRNCDCPLDPIQVRISDSIVDAACSLPAIYSNCCSPAHADLVVERSTIFGGVCVQQISKAENSLFAGLVRVQRRSIGYMRFCYVPKSIDNIPELVKRKYCLGYGDDHRHHHATPTTSRTPQRFKCLPDTDGITQTNSCPTNCDGSSTDAPSKTVSAPVFVSMNYGDPGYAQLALDCPQSILRGADDESEVGAFHNLFHPQRMAALEARLQEYTPTDIQSAVIYADDLDLPSRVYDVFRSL